MCEVHKNSFHDYSKYKYTTNLADVLREDRSSTGMERHEISDLKDIAINDKELLCIVHSALEFPPIHMRQIGVIRWPDVSRLLVEEGLELHLPNAHLYFIIPKLLEVPSEAQAIEYVNKPLGWIVLVPLHRVTIIVRELVVEIVIAFSKSYNR
jgi:hypothetical protein